jgi:hypothetical protein
MKTTARKNFSKLQIPLSLIDSSRGFHYFPRKKIVDLNLPDARGFRCPSVLDPSECKFLLNQLETIGYEDMSHLFPSEYRSNDRVRNIALLCSKKNRLWFYRKTLPIIFGGESKHFLERNMFLELDLFALEIKELGDHRD